MWSCIGPVEWRPEQASTSALRVARIARIARIDETGEIVELSPVRATPGCPRHGDDSGAPDP
ncbi:hypothetical protein GCM10009548_38850 [Streptomyces malaysiensis subsp. malaysiensis]